MGAREGEVEDGRMRKKKRRKGESTYIDGMRPSFLLIFA